MQEPKTMGESGPGPPINACADDDSSTIANMDYLKAARIRQRYFVLMELVAIVSTVFVLVWRANPNLFGVMTPSLARFQFIFDISIACIVLTICFVVPLFWLAVFSRREKTVHRAALRWMEDGHIMEVQRCMVLDCLASFSPEILRTIAPEKYGEVETEELTLLLKLVMAGKSSLEKEPIQTENLKRIRGFLSSIPQLASLFQAHLDTTVDVTEKADVAIMQRLVEVKAVVEELVGKLGNSHVKAQLMGDVAQTTIAESRELVADMNAYHLERDRQIRDDAAGIGSVVRQIEELKALTGLIRDVTSQTNVVAINAAIEAARAGKAGSGFTIVASEVRKLSRQIDEATMLIEDSIGKVSDTARDRLSAIVAQTRIAAEEKWLSTLASALPRLSGSFTDAVTELGDLSLRTQKSVSLVRNSIMEVLGQAQFQDIARQQIEQVQKGLALLSQRIEALAGNLAEGRAEPLEIAPLREIAKIMDGNYTMLPQRKTHNATIGGRPTDDEESLPRIQLF